MDIEEINAVLRKQPFKPFRLCVSEGSQYEDWHPDQVVGSRKALYIGLREQSDDGVQPIVVLSLLHVSRLLPA